MYQNPIAQEENGENLLSSKKDHLWDLGNS